MNFEEYLVEFELHKVLNHPITKFLAKATGASSVPILHGAANHVVDKHEKKEADAKRQDKDESKTGSSAEKDAAREEHERRRQAQREELEDAHNDHKYHIGYIKRKLDDRSDGPARERAIQDAEDAHALKIAAIKARHQGTK